ncbi:DUF2845 domain-containing protein [Pseudomonas syringae]|nr:DUF2845 domain-containing protein [Pseudomonas syringae]MBD8789934.1 DUF2845 domain-containing protein [Pseudomonas syringae]MBD8799909.1 DUF2845 domain-containing protein [Pseudomonas syringae]MBD8811095.1 DUF2845 domain-containing protein [Pseudomonas syringae]
MAGSSRPCTWTASDPLNNRLIRFALLITLAGAGIGPAQASTMRCNSHLISVGDHAFEVQKKCGRPASQATLGSRKSYDSTYRRSEQVEIEEWIYGPDHGMYRYLRFEGGRLVRIESRRG